ncbi:hypothetical protein AGMMS50267_01200 [Spirochaetia bacterium]|nr:hypothetical protein AGMMS50267_01200 [Spirochaetia bacterium]
MNAKVPGTSAFLFLIDSTGVVRYSEYMNETVLNRVIENDTLINALSLPGSWRGAKVELRIISASGSNSSPKRVSTSYGVLKSGKKGIHNNFSDEQLLDIIKDARKTHTENIQ